MLYVSRFVSDRARDPELWATIWQAEVPPTLKLIGAYNLGGDERVFIWEGETTADLQLHGQFQPDRPHGERALQPGWYRTGKR